MEGKEHQLCRTLKLCLQSYSIITGIQDYSRHCPHSFYIFNLPWNTHVPFIGICIYLFYTYIGISRKTASLCKIQIPWEGAPLIDHKAREDENFYLHENSFFMRAAIRETGKLSRGLEDKD